MSLTIDERLSGIADRLITEGEQVLQSKFTASMEWFVDPENHQKWISQCRNLVKMLGESASAWGASFDVNKAQGNRFVVASRQQGELRGLREAIADGLLVKVENLVFADAFVDLLEQAEYLLSGGYFLAAGVLGRAVLEEHLRKWCDRVGYSPARPKPMLNDFKLELQKGSKLNRIEVSKVDAMAAVGNDCAHRLGKSTQADVENFIRDVRGFLEQHPLP